MPPVVSLSNADDRLSWKESVPNMDFFEDSSGPILNSSELRRSNAFNGYFFSGTDYVSGLEGLREIEAAENFTLKPGLDGCYAYAIREGSDYVFGTDHSGYRALYYFHDGDRWVVGESLTDVVDELPNIGAKVLPEYAQIGSICSTNSTNNQMFSWNTVARGVKLLPRGTQLRVTPSRAIVEALPVPEPGDYKEHLSSHLQLWVARYATVLADQRLEMSVDLTGGWCQSVEATWGSPASSRAKDSVGVRKPSRRRGRLLISSAMVVR